jgi:magnesium chelatase subunit I
LVANATRRALRNGETEAVPRISDLQALVSSTQGKVEIESLEEGREEILLSQLLSAAVLLVFRRRVQLDEPQAVIGAFDADTVVHAGDDLPATAYAGTLAQMPPLSAPVLKLTGGSEDPGVVASAVEFLLEGLHLTKRLNKEAAGTRATYRGRG